MSQEPFTLVMDDFDHGEPIPARFARCIPDGRGKTRAGINMRPDMYWSHIPPGTQSFAILVVDRDVPTRFDSANQDDKTIPQDMARKDFYHWVQVDIPADVTGLPESNAGTAKPGRSGRNDFGDRGTDAGVGYDGPCPPWNDERLHRYHFIVYALDIPTLGLSGDFSGEDVIRTMSGHILAQAEITGTFSTNQQQQAA